MNHVQSVQKTQTLDLAATDTVDGASGTDAPGLLPDPAPLGLGDGDFTALAILLTQADDKDRTAARQVENVSDQAAFHQDDAHVQALRDKADDDRDAAFASGIGDIAGGACTVVSAFVPSPSSASSDAPPGSAANPAAGSGGGAASAGANGATPTPAAPPAPDVGKAVSTAYHVDAHTILEAGAKVMPGVGTMVSGIDKGDADRDDANAAEADAKSQADLRRYNEAHDDAQAAQDSIQKVQQFLQQTLEARNATRLAAASGRA